LTKFFRNFSTTPLRKKKNKKARKPEDVKASPFPSIKGWASIKEAFSFIGYKLLSTEKAFHENIGIYWQLQSIIEKVSVIGFVVKDTVVDLGLHNLNVFDLLPTKQDLGLDSPAPFQSVRDDLKLVVFNVFSPKLSKKKIKPKKQDSSSSSSSDEETKKNDENEKKGKYDKNFKSILLPNLRYWQNDSSSDRFVLLFESDTLFNISHLIVKTPRFTKYPLRRALFYAFDTDPRIKKPKKDDESSEDEEKQYAGVYSKKKDRVIWPPEAPLGTHVPFAYVEIPANKFYVEQKLPQNVTGRYIKGIFLDGWAKETSVTGPAPLRKFGEGGHEKISIEFIGFVGPADPGEINRDVGAKFGILH